MPGDMAKGLQLRSLLPIQMKGKKKMAKLHIQKDSRNNLTTLRDSYILDNYLSLKSKGLLSLLYSFGTDFCFDLDDFAGTCSDPVGTVRSCLKELETLGYIDRKMLRDKYGRFVTVEYTVRSRMRRRPVGGEIYC